MKIIVNNQFEDFIWMSYRYCIGRKTIAACMHADTITEIIVKNPNLLSKERKEFMAYDIRREINNCFNFKKSLHIENDTEGQDIFSILLYALNLFEDRKKKVFYFDAKTASIYDTKVDPTLYEFETPDSDYIDLIPWVKLSNWLDKSTHRLLTVEWDGKIQEIVCYPYPLEVRINNVIQYHKSWCSIDNPSCGITRYIDNDCIREIKTME